MFRLLTRGLANLRSYLPNNSASLQPISNLPPVPFFVLDLVFSGSKNRANLNISQDDDDRPI